VKHNILSGNTSELSSTSTDLLDGNKIIELAESINALNICTELVKKNGEYLILLNELNLGLIDLTNRDALINTHNKLLELKSTVFYLYQDGRPHLTNVNEFGYHTRLNGLSPEFFGPRGRDYLSGDI
jgi:hypothetical protein